MNASYAYAVGNIRAREVRLLSRQDLEQLLSTEEIPRLEAALRDKGFGVGAAAGLPSGTGGEESMERLLREETGNLWSYLRSVAPDWSLFEPFLYRNDIHNCKTVIKGVLSGREFHSLLLTPSTVEPGRLEKAVRDQEYGELPLFLREAARRAYEVLAHANDAQLSDAIVDRAGMEAMLSSARDKKVPLLYRIMEITVFYSNLKIALRCARAGKSAAYLKEALCPCPGLDTGRLTEAALAGEKAVLELMEAWDSLGSRRGAQIYGESPSAFERYAEDLIIEQARRALAVTLGPEPLIGYLLVRERELKDLQILFSGLRAGQEEEAIRRRLFSAS